MTPAILSHSFSFFPAPGWILSRICERKAKELGKKDPLIIQWLISLFIFFPLFHKNKEQQKRKYLINKELAKTPRGIGGYPAKERKNSAGATEKAPQTTAPIPSKYLLFLDTAKQRGKYKYAERLEKPKMGHIIKQPGRWGHHLTEVIFNGDKC
jgi:hypothetical protein